MQKWFWLNLDTVSSDGNDEARSERIEIGAPIHLALERFQFVDLALPSTVGPRFVIRRRDLTPRIMGYQRFIAPIGVEPARRITIHRSDALAEWQQLAA